MARTDALAASVPGASERAEVREAAARRLFKARRPALALIEQARLVEDSRNSSVSPDVMFARTWELAFYLSESGRPGDAERTVVNAIPCARASSIDRRRWIHDVVSLLNPGQDFQELEIALLREWSGLELERLGKDEFLPHISYVWLARALARTGDRDAALAAYRTALDILSRDAERDEREGERRIVHAEIEELELKSCP